MKFHHSCLLLDLEPYRHLIMRKLTRILKNKNPFNATKIQLLTSAGRHGYVYDCYIIVTITVFYMFFVDFLFFFTIFHFMCTIAVYLNMSIKPSRQLKLCKLSLHISPCRLKVNTLSCFCFFI